MENKKLLIVEDEPVVALSLERLLGNAGYMTESVDCGEKALERVHQNRPDAILMDIKLKGDWDGIETAEKILAFCVIPIIYLTAYTDSKLKGRMRESGVFSFLEKPFEEDVLLETLWNTLK